MKKKHFMITAAVAVILVAVFVVSVMSISNEDNYIERNELWDEYLTVDPSTWTDFVSQDYIDHEFPSDTILERKSGIFYYNDTPDEVKEIVADFMGPTWWDEWCEDAPHPKRSGWGTGKNDINDHQIYYDIAVLGIDSNRYGVIILVVRRHYQVDSETEMRDPYADNPFDLGFDTSTITVTEEVLYDVVPDDVKESLKQYTYYDYQGNDVYVERELDIDNMVFQKEGGSYTGEDGVIHCVFVRKMLDGRIAIVYYDLKQTADHDPDATAILTNDAMEVGWDNLGFSESDVETEPAPVETEPVATEPAPGTGGTEPVVAPKTVDRLALIAGVFVISLAICAAAFTVVKEKKR